MGSFHLALTATGTMVLAVLTTVAALVLPKDRDDY